MLVLLKFSCWLGMSLLLLGFYPVTGFLEDETALALRLHFIINEIYVLRWCWMTYDWGGVFECQKTCIIVFCIVKNIEKCSIASLYHHLE